MRFLKYMEPVKALIEFVSCCLYVCILPEKVEKRSEVAEHQNFTGYGAQELSVFSKYLVLPLTTQDCCRGSAFYHWTLTHCALPLIAY